MSSRYPLLSDETYPPTPSTSAVRSSSKADRSTHRTSRSSASRPPRLTVLPATQANDLATCPQRQSTTLTKISLASRNIMHDLRQQLPPTSWASETLVRRAGRQRHDRARTMSDEAETLGSSSAQTTRDHSTIPSSIRALDLAAPSLQPTTSACTLEKGASTGPTDGETWRDRRSLSAITSSRAEDDATGSAAGPQVHITRASIVNAPGALLPSESEVANSDALHPFSAVLSMMEQNIRSRSAENLSSKRAGSPQSQTILQPSRQAIPRRGMVGANTFIGTFNSYELTSL